MKQLAIRASMIIAAALLATGCSTYKRLSMHPIPEPDANRDLRAALTLFAGFDDGLDADHAVGDPVLHTSQSAKERIVAKTNGLPVEGHVKLAENEGRFGHALQWTKKAKQVVFYTGPENMAYKTNDWAASAAFWMRISPNEDLEPGYCDPFQFVGGEWKQGSFFVEFTKENPRHFRFAQMALPELWNPNNEKYEEMPLSRRPLVELRDPLFSRDKWTHVAFTFEHANTGRKDGIAKLYVNGIYRGAVVGWDQTLGWKPEEAVINLGLNYVGYLDDIGVFNRVLTPEEVKHIFELENGMSDLL